MPAPVDFFRLEMNVVPLLSASVGGRSLGIYNQAFAEDLVDDHIPMVDGSGFVVTFIPSNPELILVIQLGLNSPPSGWSQQDRTNVQDFVRELCRGHVGVIRGCAKVIKTFQDGLEVDRIIYETPIEASGLKWVSHIETHYNDLNVDFTEAFPV